MASPIRLRARALYKELHHLGKEYPDPAYNFNGRLHSCFARYIGKDDAELEKGMQKAEFIKKELEAMYFLRKYRTMKNRYYYS